MFIKKPEWYSKAACKGLDPDLFYGEREAGTQSNVANAQEVCRQCPVIMECLLYSVEMGETHYGIWGGASPKRRRPRQIAKTIKETQQIIDDRELLVLTRQARRNRVLKKSRQI